MCFWQKARYDTRESTFSEDCEFFQCQGEPRPRLRFPETVAHRLCPDGHDQPPMPTMPSSSIIHVSGGICAPNRPPAWPPLWSGGRGCGRGRLALFTPSLPPSFLALPRLVEGRGVIARHYIDKICCPRYGHLAGRSLRAGGRHATCKLFEGGFLQKSCRRRKVVQALGGGCSCFTVIIALLQQLSLNRSRDFLALKTQDLAAFSSLGGVLFTAKVLQSYDKECNQMFMSGNLSYLLFSITI